MGISKTLTSITAGKLRLGYPESITPKENNNLELLDNYLLDKDLQEPAAEILMASEFIDNYLLDKRFMRELEDRDEYDAA